MKLTNMVVAIVLLGIAVATQAADKAPAAALSKLLEKVDKAFSPDASAVKITNHITVSEASMEMMKIKFTTTSIVAVPDKIKTITDIPGMLHQEQGFNGKIGWKFNNRMGFQLVKGEALNFLKYSAVAENVTKLEERYEKIELAEQFVVVDGIKCYKLTCYPPQIYHLAPQILYINAETFLIHKIELEAVSDMGTVATTVTLSDYKKFFGRMVPTRTTMVQMNITIKMRLLSFRINQPIAASTFDPPPNMLAACRAENSGEKKSAGDKKADAAPDAPVSPKH